MSAATAEHTGTLFFRGLGHTQRARMLDAMTWAVAEKGYPNVTVADVVARAGVSRRTFYEHFDDRLDCFLAAYETGADAVIAEISDQLRPLRDGNRMTRLRTGLRIYLRALGAEPVFARVLTVDVLGVGPEALELRERVRQRFARHWRGLGVENEQMLRALVGGIAELVQAQILAGHAESLPELEPVLVRFANAVIEGGGAWAA